MNTPKIPRGRGGGRKPSPYPLYFKKLRATPEEWEQLLKLLTGDARQDFLIILNLLHKSST